MVLANILQSLSGSINGIYIGQMLGTQALAAVAGMFPIVFFFVSLVIGVGAGASVLIGQAWGAHELGKVKAIAATALTVCLLIGLIAAALGNLFARPALQALGTPPEVLSDAVAYARVMMFTMPLLLVFIVYTQLLRGVSDTVTPLLALILSTVVGLVLTPALILGWGGLPQLGVSSAAVAGLVAFVVAFAFLVIYLRYKNHPLAPDAELLRGLGFNRRLLAAVVRIALPTSVQMVVISLSELVILGLVNHYGADAVIAEGLESGGHIGSVTSLALLPQVVDEVSIPVIAAGGLGDGRGLAAALALGAAGVQMGTRFICTDECIAHINYKEAIIKANERSTMVTGMSLGHPVRCLRNPMARDFEELEKRGASEQEIVEFGTGRLRMAVMDGDVVKGSMMAGQIAGLVHDIVPAAEVLRRTTAEAEAIMRRLGAMVDGR